MVHFQQQSATEYMNFPCDASSSPLSSRLVVRALSCTRRIIDWHSLEEEPVCSSPRALGQNKVTGKRNLLRFKQDWLRKKNSALKYCSFCPNSHRGVSGFFLFFCRRVKRVRSARCELCSSSHADSSATAPTISEAGNIISQDLVRLYI